MDADADKAAHAVAEHAARLDALVRRDAPRAPDRASLDAWGHAIGRALRRPATLALTGDLGAGKTTLVRAICAGLGVVDLQSVTSPTFALIHEYSAPAGPVVHADLYRVRSPRELEGLGWEEMVARNDALNGILMVEWPDLVRDTLPPGTIHIALRHDVAHADRRHLTVSVSPTP